LNKSKRVAVIDEHPFFHRKLAKSGGSRYLAVGRMIPPDWLIVKVKVAKLEGKVCVLEITKLD